MVDFRDSLLAKRISKLLIASLLFEMTAPALAAPWWEDRPDYPLAPKRSRRHHTQDRELSKALDKNQGPVARLPALRGERPLDGVGEVDSGHAADPSPSASPAASSPSGPAPTASEQTPSESAPEAQVQTTSSSHAEDDHETASADGDAELGWVEADPRQPFPQWEFSRQTYPNGPFLQTDQQIPVLQVQDSLLHVARKLDDPGAEESYVIDAISWRAEDNATSRGSVASVSWDYRRLSGTSASSLDAKYELVVKTWDQRCPSGRVAYRTRENMWLAQIPLHCGFALKRAGQYRLITHHNQEEPQTTVVQVSYPKTEEEGFTRRSLNQDRPISQPLVAYTSDERLSDHRTFSIPEPDESGHQDFTARVDWRSQKGGFGFTRFHSYASAEFHYTSDGSTYTVEKRFYDAHFRQGHTVEVQTGQGRLADLTVDAGFALPSGGAWRIKEVAQNRTVRTVPVTVRDLKLTVAPLTASLFQDNGSSLYKMTLKAGPSTPAPGQWRWLLSLRDAEGKLIRAFSGDVVGNTEAERDFYQIWDGQDEAGEEVPANTAITPELSVVLLNEESPLARSRSLLAAAQAEEEDWIMSGVDGRPILVDDDLQVLLNGRVIYSDTDGVRTDVPPLNFRAKVGDQLQLIATDTFGVCSELDPVYVRRVSTERVQRLTPGYIGPCDDSAHGLNFFNETYTLTDDPSAVETALNAGGSNTSSVTRSACEVAWAKTSSVAMAPRQTPQVTQATNVPQQPSPKPPPRPPQCDRVDYFDDPASQHAQRHPDDFANRFRFLGIVRRLDA